MLDNVFVYSSDRFKCPALERTGPARRESQYQVSSSQSKRAVLSQSATETRRSVQRNASVAEACFSIFSTRRRHCRNRCIC